MSLREEPRRDVCAIIPCYNEARNIGKIVRSVKAHVREALVIDDFSTDDTALEAAKAGAIVLGHTRNMGKGVALKTGFAAALSFGWAAALTLDGDGQHDCTEIPLFLEAYDRGHCDIVLGNRMDDPATMPLVRQISNRFTSWAISRMVGIRIRDTQCGFRLIGLDFWRNVDLESSHFDLESEILIKACRRGARLREVNIRTIYFGTDSSKINPVVDTFRFFHLLWRCRNA